VWSVRLVGETGPGSPGELSGLLVTTGNGQLELTDVQPEGRARQSADAWRNGSRPTPNEQLGQ
jgi:methionyl-tRNA formyltransferase